MGSASLVYRLTWLYVVDMQLPFALPTVTDNLLTFGEPHAFGPLATTPTTPSFKRMSHMKSPSLASLSSSPSNGYSDVPAATRSRPSSVVGSDSSSISAGDSSNTSLGTTRTRIFVPVIPDGFFAKLDAAKAKARLLNSHKNDNRRRTVYDEDRNAKTISSKSGLGLELPNGNGGRPGIGSVMGRTSSELGDWSDWRSRMAKELAEDEDEEDDEEGGDGEGQTITIAAGFSSSGGNEGDDDELRDPKTPIANRPPPLPC